MFEDASVSTSKVSTILMIVQRSGQQVLVALTYDYIKYNFYLNKNTVINMSVLSFFIQKKN